MSSTMNAQDRERTADVPHGISVTIVKRPRYSVEIDGTTYYRANVLGVIDLMKEHGRTLSIGDVSAAIDMRPHCKYRLRERLNGAVVRRIYNK
jgi:hypothetical protein